MSKCILYIEDNLNDQRFVEKVLGRLGYELLIAGDSESGLALAQQHTPNLILIDIQMPGVDGMETARLIRAVTHCAETPMVALTAYSEKYQRAAYIDAGFTDYQQKRAGIKPLIDLVKQYLDD